MNPTLTLVGNSPGEVSTFLRPVASELASRHPSWRQQIALVPCPYATGAEAKVIRGWNLVDEVWTPTQTIAHFIRGGHPKPGAIIFLGGDPWHALLLKKRFKIPALGYFPEPHSWQYTHLLGGFDHVLTAYSAPLQSTNPKTSFIGDLRVDAVLARLKEEPIQERSKTTLSIFPGSRWLHLKASLGAFQYVVAKLYEANPNRRFILSVSPYVSSKQLRNASAKPLNFGLATARGEVVGDKLIIEGGAQIELIFGNPYSAIAQCDLALSLPGTNTAELAIAGKPVVVPLSARAPVGGGGLLGLIDQLPGLSRLKLKLRFRKYNKLPLLALPNRIAGRIVTPEFFVRDDLLDLFDFLDALLDNAAQREHIGAQLRSVMGTKGAAKKLVDVVEAIL